VTAASHGRWRARGLSFGLTLGLALTLAGCDGNEGSASAATATPVMPAAMARGKVEVEGGLFEVLAPVEGTVESVTVKEGDSVRRGQVLLQLQADQARLDVDMAEAELSLIQSREHAQRARQPAARQLAERTAAAARAGAFEQQRADEAHQALQDIESGISVLESEQAVARQKLRQARLAEQRLTVRAAADASVLKLAVQPGARVGPQAGRALMVLLPHRPLLVRAELNESFLASVHPGMSATVTPDVDLHPGEHAPSQQARVARLSPAYSGSRLGEDAVRGSVRVVDCFLELDPAASSALRLGQNVKVSFHE